MRFSSTDMILLEALLPVAILFLAAVLLFMKDTVLKGKLAHLDRPLTILALVLSFVSAWYLWPKDAVVKLSFVTVDRFAVATWMLIFFSVSLAALMKTDVGEKKEDASVYGLVLLSTLGMCLAPASNNLLSMLVGITVMFLPLAAITFLSFQGDSGPKWAFRYVVLGACSIAVMAMGIAFLFGSLGSFDFQVIIDRSQEITSEGLDLFYLFGLSLTLVGIFFFLFVVPFHAWFVSSFEVGALSSRILSTGQFVCAFAVLAKVTEFCLGEYNPKWCLLMSIFAALTMLTGALGVFRERNLSKLIAHFVVLNAGALLALFPSVSFGLERIKVALFTSILAYVFTCAGLFASVCIIKGKGADLETATLSGLFRKSPAFCAGLLVLLLSASSLPPTFGFYGRYYLIVTMVRNGDLVMAGFLALASTIVAVAFFRIVSIVFFREEAKHVEPVIQAHGPSPAVFAVFFISCVATLAFGIYPENIVSFLWKSMAL